MKQFDDADENEPRHVEINKAVQRDMNALPEHIRDQFLVSLEQVSLGLEPGLPITYLYTVGNGVVELKINGRPAYRLVYTMKFAGQVIVLAARAKTTQGPDKKLLKVSALRLKSYS